MLCRRRPVSVYPDGNNTTCNLDSPLKCVERLDVSHRVEPEAMSGRAAEGPHLPDAVVHGPAFEWRLSPRPRHKASTEDALRLRSRRSGSGDARTAAERRELEAKADMSGI